MSNFSLKIIHAVLWVLLVGGCQEEIGPKGKRVGEPIGQLAPEGQEAHEAKEIIGGYAHVCAHLTNDRVKCWGRNDEGQCNLKSARNVEGTLHDLRHAQFSKLAAGASFTCGIVKDAPFKGIPFCFGEEGSWLDIPNEPIIDISAGHALVCFLKADGRLGCEGSSEVRIISKDAHGRGHVKMINARDLVKQGIDPVSKQMDQDFSNKKFKSVRVGRDKACAQGADDGIVYCMGGNLSNSGHTPTFAVADYAAGDEHHTFLIFNDGSLNYVGVGMGFYKNKGIPDPYMLKYKKFQFSPDSLMLLTSTGNKYADGRVMPESTLITGHGVVEEGGIGAASLNSSFKADRFSVICILKDNHKVKCVLPPDWPGDTNNTLFTDIPPEIAY